MQGTFKGSANLGTGEEIRIFSRILTLLAYSIESEQINEPYSSGGTGYHAKHTNAS